MAYDIIVELVATESVIFTITAKGYPTNQNIAWNLFTIPTDSQTDIYYDTSIAIATKLNNNNFAWGVASTANINGIYLTAFNDIQYFYISSYIPGVGSATAVILPKYVDNSIVNLTDTVAVLSTYFSEVSSNVRSNITKYDFVEWTISPVYSGLSASIGDGNWKNLINYSSPSGIAIFSGLGSAGAKQLSAKYIGNETDIDFTVTSDSTDTQFKNSPLSASYFFNLPSTKVTLNPSVQVYVLSADTSSTILCAVKLDDPAPSNTPLVWTIDNDTSLSALKGNPAFNTTYPFGTVDLASNIGIIKLATSDLTDSYTYALCSFSGKVSGFFRPYQYLETSSDISARVIRLENEENTYKYSIQAVGITDSVAHNIGSNQSIVWSCDNPIVYANYADDINQYSFDFISEASNIDNLIIRITPDTTSTVPKICTVNFQLCALIGDSIEDDFYDVYNFSIDFNEWLDEAIFNPQFRFQYEPDTQTTIYRPVSGALTYYTISNTSIIPPSSVGIMEFGFDDGVSAIPFNTITGNAPSAFVHTFATASPCICTMTLSVSTSAAGYLEYFIRQAIPKQLVVATIPLASGFEVYPEFNWNGSTWQRVVSSYGTNQGILSPFAASNLLTGYGVGHTENYFLSSNAIGTSYKWDILDNKISSLTYTAFSTAATAWIPVKTGTNSSEMSVCATVFTNALSSDMPSRYYDTVGGIPFNNFADTTNASITGIHRKNIQLIGADDLGISANMNSFKYAKLPIPNILYLSGGYTSMPTSSLFGGRRNAFYFNVTSDFWSHKQAATDYNITIATAQLNINVDDIGDSFLGLPQNEVSEMSIVPEIGFTLTVLSAHPSASDWTLENLYHMGDAITIISAYPIVPLIYNPNRFVITGENVQYDNLVPYFSSSEGTSIDGFVWTDRNNTVSMSTNTPYVTNYNVDGTYDIRLQNIYYYGTSATLENLFTNIVTVQKEYLKHSPNIARIFDFTSLEMPHDYNDCSMAPNEWVVKDTFNACVIKLNENLEYLNYMSQLYDVPPTDYIGWYGTLYYNNNVPRTRWYTNTPRNSYGYENPDKAIDHMFTNLQSCFIIKNVMYVSDGTIVHILSGDLWGTPISSRNYKTIGDDFINIRSIKLDSEGRIYLLDSYDSNDMAKGSKNRVIVFEYRPNTQSWILLYEWGGLGGAGAKNKFNSPSDLYMDDKDVLWIADTDNKCVKKYTRTGSWLNTLTSTYFNDNQKPISIVTDKDENVYVLTNTQIVKFDSRLTFIAVYTIPEGGLKLKNCRDGGFVYIVYSGYVVKFTDSGETAGIIAEGDFNDYTKDYRNVFHDEYRNLYIINKNHILKYVDQLSIVSLKLDTTDVTWPLENLLVNKDEYVQDWVINRCFQRLYDNIEIFRQSLIGKFGYQTVRNITHTSVISSQVAPDEFNHCERDWLYSFGRLVDKTVVYEYLKPIVRTYTLSEYKSLPYTKDTIYVGLNEINAAEVYNRVIKKLYECENVLLQMINNWSIL